MLTTREINKNITLTYIPMGKLKTTTVGFYIHRPLSEDEASMNALLAAVMKQGSSEYPGMEYISKRLDSLYGSRFTAAVSKKGEDQIIAFEAEGISDRYVPEGEELLKELIDFILGVIFKPLTEGDGFKKDIFAQEKKNLIDKIRAAINDKRVYAHEKLCKITSEGSRYAVSRLGDEEYAQAIENADLFDHYKNIITSSPIDIYIAGDADVDMAEETVKKAVSEMNFNEGKIQRAEILSKREEPKKVSEAMDVTQGKLAMSFTTGIKPTDEAYWGMVVANSIFGAGAHSKLFNNVREKLSLAYYAGSQMHKHKGFIAVNAGVEFENFNKAYDEILIQLDELKKGNISELEMTAAKMALVNNLNSYYDDQFYMQSFYLGEKVCGTNYDIDYYIEKINAVTIEDVVSSAKNISLDSVYFLKGKE